MMSLSVRPWIATTGVAAIAAAGLLRFVVVPAQAQLPADLDVTRVYTGTATSMLDAQALAAGDLANAVLRDVPITITRDLLATDVTDGIATVAEQAVITLPDGTPIATSTLDHVLDRRTMLAADDREGLLIGWPIGTEARDYVGWSTDLAAPIDLVHEGTEEHAGIDTMVFTSTYSGPIVDAATLARFPASLPKAILPVAAEALGVSEAVTSQLPALLEQLPTDVPLAYTLSGTTTYWVDGTTGTVIDIQREEHRFVGLDVEGVPAIPLADVFGLTYTGDADSVAATVIEAQDAGSQLRLYGTTLPVGLLIAGIALVAASLRRRREVDLTTSAPIATIDTTRERVHA